MRTWLKIATAAAVLVPASARAQEQQPPPADPLTAKVDVSDVERFAALWKKTEGHPTAAQLDADYINGGGIGIKVFTPQRIINGANMERQIAAHREWYEQALGKCLPWVGQNNAQLRSIYLGLQGLLPEKPLPQIYMVIGGANSGGTAGPGAQVLGLEILCRDGPTPEKFAEELRTFFAHETAHTFQNPTDATFAKEPLLAQLLIEGGADYVASIITGAPPNAAREAYGRANEAQIWAQFVKDRTVANGSFDVAKGYGKVGQKAFDHWLYNGGHDKLPGWETDMGYWLGMEIIKAYVAKSADPHAAIREALALEDPAEILRKSGYADKFRTTAR